MDQHQIALNREIEIFNQKVIDFNLEFTTDEFKRNYYGAMIELHGEEQNTQINNDDNILYVNMRDLYETCQNNDKFIKIINKLCGLSINNFNYLNINRPLRNLLINDVSDLSNFSYLTYLINDDNITRIVTKFNTFEQLIKLSWSCRTEYQNTQVETQIMIYMNDDANRSNIIQSRKYEIPQKMTSALAEFHRHGFRQARQEYDRQYIRIVPPVNPEHKYDVMELIPLRRFVEEKKDSIRDAEETKQVMAAIAASLQKIEEQSLLTNQKIDIINSHLVDIKTIIPRTYCTVI